MDATSRSARKSSACPIGTPKYDDDADRTNVLGAIELIEVPATIETVMDRTRGSRFVRRLYDPYLGVNVTFLGDDTGLGSRRRGESGLT